MRSIEASGKTVKDAIRNGLAELGCDSDDVDIQVIEMGSPGLFGMFGKPAKVRLTVKAEDPALDIEMPVLSLDAGSAKKPKQEKRKADKPRQEKPAPKAEKPEEAQSETEAEAAEDAGEAPREKKSRNRRRRRGGANRGEGAETREAAEAAVEESIGEPAPALEQEPFVPTPVEEQSDEAKRAKDFLAGLTERMGVPVEIALQEGEEQLRMQMTGENMSLLIGRRGETLDALQYLTSLNINRGREEYLRVSIDTEN